MSGLSVAARLYVLGLILIGAAVVALELAQLPHQNLGPYVALLSAAILSFVLKKEDPSRSARRTGFLLLLIAGAVLTLLQLPRLQEQNTWMLVGLGSLAAAGHVFKQPGPTSRSSYQMSFMVYGFSFVLFGAAATTLIILIAHTLEYALGAYYPAHIQSFNVASFATSTGIAGVMGQWANDGLAFANADGTVGILLSFASFIVANHFIVGIVLKLARGQNFRESGVFGTLTLMIDFCLLSMGAGAALLWKLDPYAVVLGTVPLYLVYNTLRVPHLERQTETDAKTGAYNHRYFNDVLEQELARANRYDRPLTLVMADLDFLREINNTYGHLAGDAVLKGVVGILKQKARAYDIVARFGGEEFVMLMPETAPTQAQPLIESICQTIAAAQYEVPGNNGFVGATMSFGIAGRGAPLQTADDIIRNADLALYQAKEAGRNRVVLFDHE